MSGSHFKRPVEARSRGFEGASTFGGRLPNRVTNSMIDRYFVEDVLRTCPRAPLTRSKVSVIAPAMARSCRSAASGRKQPQAQDSSGKPTLKRR